MKLFAISMIWGVACAYFIGGFYGLAASVAGGIVLGIAAGMDTVAEQKKKDEE